MKNRIFLKRTLTGLTMALLLGWMMASPLLAHDPKLHSEKTNAPKDITLIGEVIDPGCFLIHGAQGAEHKSCAEMCAKNGTTLTVLDEKSQILYIPISADHEKNPNEKLLPFAGERVKVTGKAIDQYGYHGIAIQSVSRLEEKK